jgi:hypothetical protein
MTIRFLLLLMGNLFFIKPVFIHVDFLNRFLVTGWLSETVFIGNKSLVEISLVESSRIFSLPTLITQTKSPGKQHLPGDFGSGRITHSLPGISD